MTPARPELIFVAGPQEGERAVLMTNVVLVGRSASADVRLLERSASREQARFELTSAGWILENLSAGGTRINGKRFKKGKKLLLDTGDVLGVGAHTRVLYVAPEDDPEQAVRAYRQAHPAPPPPAAPPPELQPAAAAPPAAAQPEPKTEEVTLSGEQAPEPPTPEPEEAASKLKYILFGAVMVGLCILSMALIMRMTQGGGDGELEVMGRGLRRLTDTEISEALAAPLERSPSPASAAEMLDLALRYFPDRHQDPGNLFRCVKSFKLHRAYKHSKSFDRVQYERMFEQASDELDLLVREKYDAAWKFEKARSWRSAKQTFEQILEILPVAELERGGVIYRTTITNVIQHLTYIKRNLGKKR